MEGFLGSAIQLQTVLEIDPERLLENGIELVLIHALNPFGFSRRRRMDGANVDLNRNFLVPGEVFEGSHEYYRKLDPFLNPKCWPRRELPAQFQALGKAARYGMGNLKQAIAEGQYDFPLGLFYGGDKPTESVRFFESTLLEDFQSAEFIFHLDIHSGLGKHGTFEYLIDYQISSEERDWLNAKLEANLSEEQSDSAYQARGSLIRWLRRQNPSALSICWEFGTFHPISVLAALRAENAACHWGDRDSKSFRIAKNRLKEAFCPPSESWRETVLSSADVVIKRVVKAWGAD